MTELEMLCTFWPDPDPDLDPEKIVSDPDPGSPDPKWNEN